jgi:DNA-directed RNA polymerase specialized sigma24 family protein
VGVAGDDQRLRRFLARRDAGDEAGARAAWGELLTAEWPRIRAMVRLDDGLFSDTERDDALGLAATKLWRDMIGTFRGTTKGEWVNAARKCVWYACRDVQRDAARRHAREELGLGEDESATWRHDKFAREQERAEATDFVAWALPRIPDERQRHVVTRDREGATADELVAELGVSLANLYKLRQRGHEALAKLKEQWDA